MKCLVSILLILNASIILAQDSIQNKKIEFRGYIKDLQSLTFDKNFNQLITGNLIHNRINFKYKPVAGFTAALEMRNRLFWGEEVRLTPDFSSRLDYLSESVDLSHAWIETENMVFHTNIDRLWLEYSTEALTLRLGRQRINWGIGTTWNPNDVFNTYNFLDFDYEERPACDAVNIQYRIGGTMSAFDFAVSRSNATDENVIAAAKYFTNHWNYDFQFIVGWFLNQPTAGLGWSGSIDDAGFKGEVQYFIERDSVCSHLNFVLESDYVFANGWYVSIGALFNEGGLDESIQFWNASQLEFSPRNLMPTKWNTIATVAKEINPLFTVNASFIYSPKTNLLIVLPSIQYNIATNVDINLVWQSFFAEQQDKFEGLSHRVFLRFKWSF